MERLKTDTPDNLTDEERETIAALLHYPSLEKFFEDSTQKHGLNAMKQKMRLTISELERVVRRGSQIEAEKAGRIIDAYQTTLKFLDELEQRRKNQSV